MCFQTLQKPALCLYEQPLMYFREHLGERSHRAAREKLMVFFCDQIKPIQPYAAPLLVLVIM